MLTIQNTLPFAIICIGVINHLNKERNHIKETTQLLEDDIAGFSLVNLQIVLFACMKHLFKPGLNRKWVKNVTETLTFVII